MKKIIALLLAAVMLLGLAACAAKTEPAPVETETKTEAPAAETPAQTEEAPAETAEVDSAKTYKIGFSVKTLTNEPFQAFIADMIKTKVEEAGCEFVLATTSSAEDVAQQVSQIEDMLQSGIDALIVNPLDSSAVIPALEKCKEAGVPVIMVDSGPADGTDESLYVTYIGTDNYAGSKTAAEKMVEELNGEGKVVIVRGVSGNTAGEARANGFKAGLEGSNVQLVAEQPGNWSNDDALQAMENMLIANPDLNGVYSCSDVMLDGILEAIENSGRDDILIYSFDGLSNGCQLVLDGKVNATMQQYPAVMGELAVEYILQILNGEKTVNDFEKFIDSGVAYVTQDTAADALLNAA